MKQSLNLIQDLEFTEAAEIDTVAGGFTIGLMTPCWSGHLGDHGRIAMGSCFPQPQPLPHPIRPVHPPMLNPSHPGPRTLPTHLLDFVTVRGGPFLIANH